MKTMVISIRNTAGVRCREVVRFSEGPLSYLPTRKIFLAGYSAVFCVTLLKNCRTGFNGQNCTCAE